MKLERVGLGRRINGFLIHSLVTKNLESGSDWFTFVAAECELKYAKLHIIGLSPRCLKNHQELVKV